MTVKKANWLFLTMILLHIGIVLLLTFAGDRINIDIITNFFISEGILMVPAFLFLSAARQSDRQKQDVRPFEAATFHKIKISSLLMIVLCTFLMTPLVGVLNALTMFFTDNAVASLQGDIMDMPFVVMWFMIGIFGPFCEEFVFRGIIYRSYRGTGRNGIRAILLSALLFGLMHMNYNQALYAFAIGIFLAVLVEATGSLWASMFCHMFFNSVEVVKMYAINVLLQQPFMQMEEEVPAELAAQSLTAVLSFYLVMAAVTTPIAVCVIAWIAKNEGRQTAMMELLSGPKKMGNAEEEERTEKKNDKTSVYLMSIPLIVAVVLCLGFMSLEFFL